MEVIPGIDGWPKNLGNTVVTIGMFDGVHRGHRKIIDVAHSRARELSLRCVVFTFDRHPLEVLKPGQHPPILSTSAQKLKLLEELDVDLVLLSHFDTDLSRIPAADFLNEILIDKLGARVIVVGENFRFGHRGEGDIYFMTQAAVNRGVEVIPVELLKEDGEVISSTSIRKLLEEGKVEEANRRLGWDYILEGFVVHGDSRGSTLGFPTANLEVHDQRCIPADGVYGGEAFWDHGFYPAAIYIGDVPTFQISSKRIEVHIMGCEENLYGKHLGISFLFRVRTKMAFDSGEDLRRQIVEDIEKVKIFFQTRED